jgi:hypothetical protein
MVSAGSLGTAVLVVDPSQPPLDERRQPIPDAVHPVVRLGIGERHLRQCRRAADIAGVTDRVHPKRRVGDIACGGDARRTEPEMITRHKITELPNSGKEIC